MSNSAATITPEQSQALKTRGTSVALAAGAGCGKTFVLTERYLSHLEPKSADAPNPAQLSQLIAITFTEAAAREMRRRIRDKCFERLRTAKTPDSKNYWLRMLRAIEAARVSTIHAFCASLLRSHAIEADVDSSFGVLEQGEADVLQSQAIDDVLRERLIDEADTDTRELAAAFGLSRLKQQIRELLRHRHEAAFEEWLNKPAEEIVAKWQRCFDRDAFPAAVREIADATDLEEILRLLHSVTPPANKERFVQAKADLLDLLPRLRTGQLSVSDLELIRESAKVQSVCSVKDWPDGELFERYKKACSSLRAAIDKSAPGPFDPAAALEEARLGLLVLRLANDVAQDYERQKSIQNKLDFDDLLARAHKLLVTHEEIRDGFSSSLTLLLVDEFQDTDELQVDLVRLLCGDGLNTGKLFFVGDFKQSIYRFRGAQPRVFHNLKADVPASGRLPLSVNFRSQPAILNFVNALFSASFGPDYEPLQPHRAQTTAEPAVEFLWTITPDKKSSLKGSVRAAREQEARWIARRLRGLIDSRAPIIAAATAPAGTRPLELGDVAILFRALSDVDIYESALREFGLDYYLVGGHAFYAQQEIYDVLNLLRAVASPADEISLVGVLRSPFFSLADETLYWLVESAGTLNDGLFSGSLPKELTPEEHTKAAAAAQTLQYLRARKDSLPIAVLLTAALARTGYDAALLAEFLGERKLANLNKLLEQARAADRGGVLDLAGFIAQLDEFVTREPKEALAATLSESANVIRLMTIHGAKGLEFPLVIVPDLDRKPEFRTPPAALHGELGPVVSAPKDDDNDPPSVGMTLYRMLEKPEEMAERERLLYVACTRAADYLILASSVASLEKLESDWMKLIARQFDLANGGLRATLPAGYAPPHILVTSDEPPTDHRPTGGTRGPDLVALVDQARDAAARGEATVPRGVGPIAPELSARRQFSVSRLSGRLLHTDPHERDSPQESLPLITGSVDPLELGRLVHAVLQRIAPRGKNAIVPLCERLAAEFVLQNADHAAELARDMIERFVASPRWSAIAAAPNLHRELEFLLAWPPGQANGDGLYLQGYMDCLYRDAAGWHLVDYKTNDVAAEGVPQLAQHYEMQMLVYAMAVEAALGVPPVELVLHFLRPGVEHTFEWNDAARNRGVDLVNQAIAAQQTSANEVSLLS